MEITIVEPMKVWSWAIVIILMIANLVLFIKAFSENADNRAFAEVVENHERELQKKEEELNRFQKELTDKEIFLERKERSLLKKGDENRWKEKVELKSATNEQKSVSNEITPLKTN